MFLSKLHQNCFMEVSERNWLNNVQTLYREGAIPEPILSAGLAFMRLLQLAVVCRMPAGVGYTQVGAVIEQTVRCTCGTGCKNKKTLCIAAQCF